MTDYPIATVSSSVYPPIRWRWLNALIVGAAILVWLSLVGTVVAAIALGVAAAGTGDVTIDTPTVGMLDDGLYHDPLGGTCASSEVSENGWCP